MYVKVTNSLKQLLKLFDTIIWSKLFNPCFLADFKVKAVFFLTQNSFPSHLIIKRTQMLLKAFCSLVGCLAKSSIYYKKHYGSVIKNSTLQKKWDGISVSSFNRMFFYPKSSYKTFFSKESHLKSSPIFLQCQWGFWWDLPYKRCGDEQWCLHLHPPRNLHVHLQDWYHLVSIWWSKLWDEVWKLDLQWVQGRQQTKNAEMGTGFKD